MANEMTVPEIRYDLDVLCIEVEDRIAICSLSARWGYRNSVEKTARLVLAAKGPQVLS